MSDIGAEFRRLHQPGSPFVLVNVWDIGTARMMEALGAKAIATSSAALALSMGKADGTLTREESLTHAAEIVRAVGLPVSADLENGYGDSPAEVAETTRLAAAAGLAGMSVEDTQLPGQEAYPLELAAERIRAAAAAARELGRDFVLTARADGVMTGAYDFSEAKRRLLAFAAAGADCLYAPALEFDDLAALCADAPLPVNALAAGAHARRRRAEFAAIGCARLSLGGALAGAASRLARDAGKAMLGEDGDFSALASALPWEEWERLVCRPPAKQGRRG